MLRVLTAWMVVVGWDTTIGSDAGTDTGTLELMLLLLLLVGAEAVALPVLLL